MRSDFAKLDQLPDFMLMVRERTFDAFTFCLDSRCAAASPENSHLYLCPSAPNPVLSQTVSLTGMLVLVACAPAFPNASPHDVYHSFPALFCAGDSRIVERSFVTLFRRSRVAK